MNRRDVLKSFSGTYGMLAADSAPRDLGRSPGSSSRNDSKVARRDPVRDSAGEHEVITDEGISLRQIGEKIDPVRPARRLRGHGAPHSRDDPPGETASDSLPPADTYSHDTSYLPDAVDDAAVVDHAYDFGMAHRMDKGIAEQHRFTESDGGPFSVREVADRHADEDSRDFDWLFFNTFLPYMYGFDGKNYYNAGDYWDRRPEIGWMLRDEGYDVAALCEAFEVIKAVGKCADPFRGDGAYHDPTEEIVEAAGNVVEYVRGPDRYNNSPACNATDSGLRALLLDSGSGQPPDVIRHEHEAYAPENRAKPDHRGNKGWSYLELDLGVGGGNVDLFHTHMQSGNNPEERNGQLSALLSAVDNHSRPENVTIVGGDLNYDHGEWRLKSRPNYQRLLSGMGQRGLQEVWLTHGGIESTTAGYDGSDDPSELSFCDGVDSDPECGCGDYVERDGTGGTATTRAEKYRNCTRDDHDCGGGYSKLDYVFVEKPKPSHRLNVDIRRVRRRIFPRKGPCSVETGGHDTSWSGEQVGPATGTYHGEYNYLSDHMGIELRTVVSPN